MLEVPGSRGGTGETSGILLEPLVFSLQFPQQRAKPRPAPWWGLRWITLWRPPAARSDSNILCSFKAIWTMYTVICIYIYIYMCVCIMYVCILYIYICVCVYYVCMYIIYIYISQSKRDHLHTKKKNYVGPIHENHQSAASKSLVEM